LSPQSETEIDRHIGRQIRRRRRQLEKSQQDVAAACGVRFQQIQKYEAGTNRISAARLWKVAEMLGVPMGYFFEGLGARQNGETPQALATPS
jgi:transcriptional regulator with XRE-family HTH domain